MGGGGGGGGGGAIHFFTSPGTIVIFAQELICESFCSDTHCCFSCQLLLTFELYEFPMGR